LQVSKNKPAKFQGALSKPEKPNGGKSMHELCRFAGLFSLVPTKNTRIFRWMEQKSDFVDNLWKSPHM
jgi:hypothetical protein